MKKLFCALSCLLAASSAISAENVLSDGKNQIYIDDFVVQEKLSDEDLVALYSPEEIEKQKEKFIGELGEFIVMKGKRSKDTIAYVIASAGRNYVIGNKILVKCNKSVFCLPPKTNYETLNNDYYAVIVEDYDEWLKTINNLSSAPNVVKTAPSYNYGVKAY